MNEETRTITIRTEVANPEHKLKPGMFASVRIQLNGDGQVLAVPAEAVLEEGDARVVFVKREGEFAPRVIRTGIKEDGFLEVLDGLEPGDVVVTRGHFQLKSKLLDDVLKSSGHTH
jgi:membrane fusion protein, copper/silver efflux system